MTTAQSVPRPSERIAWQVVEGEAVVLDLDAKTLLGLNRTGSRMWALMDGQRSLESIASQVAAETGGEAARVLADAEQFFGRLVERKLIVL